MCNVYEGSFSKLTRANSFIASGRIIIVLKKQHDGKPSDCYVAYDYKTKKQLTFHWEKDRLIEVVKRLGDRLNELDI